MIARLWRVLFGGCEHKWHILHECHVYVHSTASGKKVLEEPVGRRIYFQCERCGDVKRKEFA